MKNVYFKILSILIVSVLIFNVSTNAQISNQETIPFQGVLYENGEAFNGTKTIVFSISDENWEETQSVQVINGLYSVILGSVVPLPYHLFFQDSQKELNITVDGTSLGEIDLYKSSGSYGGLYDISNTDSLGRNSAFRSIVQGSNVDRKYIKSGVIGEARTDNGSNAGVLGSSFAPAENDAFQFGVLGRAGGEGSGARYGLRGEASGTGTGFSSGVRGQTWVIPTEGGLTSGGDFTAYDGIIGGSSFGVRGSANGPGRNIGVYGNANNGEENWAGWFDGDVRITGNLLTDLPLFPRKTLITNELAESDTVFHIQIDADSVTRGLQLDMNGEGRKYAIRANNNSKDTDDGFKIAMLGSSIGQGTGNHEGVRGQALSNGKSNTGVLGIALGEGNGGTGYDGDGSYNNGITGLATGNNWGNSGVFGRAYGDTGVDNIGVVGLSEVGDSTNTGIYNNGLLGRAEGPGVNRGVVGIANGGAENWAGWFEGNVNVQGSLDMQRLTIPGANGNRSLLLSSEGPDGNDGTFRLSDVDGLSRGVLYANGFFQINDSTREWSGSGGAWFGGANGNTSVQFGSLEDSYNGGYLNLGDEQGDTRVNLKVEGGSGRINLMDTSSETINLNGADGSIHASSLEIGNGTSRWISGNLANNGNIGSQILFSGGIDSNGNQLDGGASIGNKFWLADYPQNGYVHINSPNGHKIRMEAESDGSNEWGRISMFNHDGTNEKETISLNGSNGSLHLNTGKSNASMSVDFANDPNGNDPNAYTPELFLNGDASPNIQMGGQPWNNGNLGFMQLFGSNPDGNGWYFSNASLSIGRDNDNGKEWGTLSLSNNDGTTSSEMINLDGASGSASFASSINAAAFNTTSDKRYKKNIKQLKGALEITNSLRGVRYNWRNGEFENKDFNDKNQIGLIAQEVEEVLPEFVHTDKDGMKSVNYTQMTAVLIEAVKELSDKVSTLESENSNLKAELSEVASLKSKIDRIEKLLIGDKKQKPSLSLSTSTK